MAGNKFLSVVLFLIFVILVFTFIKIKQIENTVNYQFHIPINNINLKMTDMTWDKLPPLLKEAISKNSLPTKLNKKDLLEISKAYEKLANEIKNPISLKETANAGK